MWLNANKAEQKQQKAIKADPQDHAPKAALHKKL